MLFHAVKLVVSLLAVGLLFSSNLKATSYQLEGVVMKHQNYLVPATTSPSSLFCVKFHYQSREGFINSVTVLPLTDPFSIPKWPTCLL